MGCPVRRYGRGWLLFLLNLKLHLTYFAGQTATAMLPTAMWTGPREQTWADLTGALGLPAAPAVGERVEVASDGAPAMAGTVADVAPWRLALVVDEPAPGTAILAVEGTGDEVGVSIWSYLYGPEGAPAVERNGLRWQQWLDERAATPG